MASPEPMGGVYTLPRTQGNKGGPGVSSQG